ncbi:MAG: hypothetical protein AAGD32_14075 [Planctomycetota bacterium]
MPATLDEIRSVYRPATLHEPIQGVDAVDDGVIEAFGRDGFIAVANVFTPEEVES